MENQRGTSGTPFWQIKQYCEANQRPFHYCCVGINDNANTRSLFERAAAWKIEYITNRAVNEDPISHNQAFLDSFISRHSHLYLTICLDVFAECFSPGVSAPQPLGLDPIKALPLLKYILQTGKVVSIDIAELSPRLDPEGKTSRLAAAIAAELLHSNS